MTSRAIAWVGGALNAVAAMPQVYRSRRRHTTKDLHVGTLALRIAGAAAILAYGILEGELVFVVVNALVLTCEGLLLAAKVRDACGRDVAATA